MLVVLVVANPRTSDAVLRGYEAQLDAAGAQVATVDLRGAVSPESPRRRLPARAVRAITAGWVAARSVDPGAARLVSTAEIVVAGDAMAVPTVWRARHTNRAGRLLNGVPAAVAEIAGRPVPSRQG